MNQSRNTEPFEPQGLITRFRCLGAIDPPEADQVRLALRLRANRNGKVVNFDRHEVAHAAALAGVEG